MLSQGYEVIGFGVVLYWSITILLVMRIKKREGASFLPSFRLRYLKKTVEISGRVAYKLVQASFRHFWFLVLVFATKYLMLLFLCSVVLQLFDCVREAMPLPSLVHRHRPI